MRRRMSCNVGEGGRFLPGVESERLPEGLYLPARSANAERRNLAGLETGTVSLKKPIVNTKSLPPIESPEGLDSFLNSTRILPEEHDSWKPRRHSHPVSRNTGTL
jgi:hypothetical protein